MSEEALFQAAAPMPAADRAAFLDRECAGNSALRARLEALLAAHDQPDTLASPDAVARRPTIALDLAHDSCADDAVGLTIGRYRLLERLGEGGCGVVYVAEQSEPVRRRVALKLIKPGMDSKAVIARFEAERQALAMMDHPNIAKVLEADTSDRGRPYFVMELVRGIRITEYCDQEKLPVHDRLNLFIKVCQAIQHAHQKGIIHRDIKPSNILVTLHDGVPVPKVIDFGIAKAVEGRLTDATVYTQLHQFLGTPAYMSPEQAEMSGLDIDTRSDIYSLGVLLYELLTGVTPFDAKELASQGLDAMRRTIREKEPVRPSTRLTQLQAARAGTPFAIRDSRFATDLDWIVMKCLEKDRARRYETANGLAADLKRHLNHEPVVARPPTAAYRFQKAWGRNKLAFSAAAAVAMALLAGIGVSTSQAIRALRAERKARLAEQEERRQAEQARFARDRATQAEAEALAHLRDARRSTYVSEMSVAFAALADNNLGRVRELLDRQRPAQGAEDFRAFEWRYLWQLARGDEFATFEDQVAKSADFSPDGRYFAYGDSRVIVRESATLKTLATLEVGALTLRFAPRSHWLASAQDQVIIWDTDQWQPLRTFPEAGHTALFSPNERWFVAGIPGGYRVWDTTTWQPLGDCTGAPVYRWHARHAVAFSPDSKTLMTIAGDGYPLGDHLRVWQLPSLEEREPVRVADGEISAVTFSPDGRKLVTGLFDGRIVVWDFATRRALLTKREHTAWIPAVMSANDGRTFFTASADRTLIVWDWDTGEPRVRLRGHTGELWSAALSPDGQRAISGSNDGTTKIWLTHPSPKEVPLVGPNLVAGFSDGGRRLIGVSTNAFVMCDPASGMRAETLLPPIQAPVLTADWGRPYAIQPTELVGVRGRSDGMVEAWDLRTGSRRAQWRAHDQRVGTLAFSADGRLLATGSRSGDVKVWDFAAQREFARFGPVSDPVLCVAFSPDGQSLAASTAGESVWVWGLESRQGIRLGGNPGPVFSVAFSPDGACLANTTMAANEVRLWELPSGKPLAPLRGHLEGVCSVAFSPDGRTLATGCTDRRVTLWNFATRQEMAKIRPGSAIPMVDFSPDGTWLTVGDLAGGGRQIRSLRAPSFAEIDHAEKLRMAKPAPP